jgi:hypothetical protein
MRTPARTRAESPRVALAPGALSAIVADAHVWRKPAFEVIKMDAEIGSYDEDGGRDEGSPVLHARVTLPIVFGALAPGCALRLRTPRRRTRWHPQRTSEAEP